ncbi:TetR/AcrR family transcriptional regulator [Streptosporangium sp. CA-135522]|uniref:TetR/AcrR family transcriptional regulator n=1 Tax=Streptosporangium sp. CA-135522 TaxID=3240072 RepID=UPI003D93625E
MPLRLSRSQAKARTRRRLLAAAAEVFAEQGFAGASVDEIATRAGHTVGAVYSHFTGKDELFLTLFDEHATRHLDGVEEITPEWEEDEGVFAAFGEYLTEVADHHAMRGTLEMEFLRYALSRPELTDRLAARWRTSRTAVARLVDPHCAAHDPAAVATAIIGLFEGLVTQRRADRAAVPSELFAEALRWLTTGLRHTPGAIPPGGPGAGPPGGVPKSPAAGAPEGDTGRALGRSGAAVRDPVPPRERGPVPGGHSGGFSLLA